MSSATVANLYPGDDRGGLDGECKIAVDARAPFDSSTPYWEEKARACKIVASHPEGAVLNQIVAELHGKDEVESGSKEYHRIRRFLSSHPNFFEVRKLNGLVSAAPTLELLDLIKRGIIQRPGERACNAGSQFEGDREYCERLLRSIGWDGEEAITERGRDLLEENLSEYLDRINDLRLVLRSPEADPEYLTLPYKTRFNDEGRIRKQHAILGNELEAAATEMGYRNAAMVTLTTDPKKFGSVWEMWCGAPGDRNDNGINGSWNRFMSWLSSDSRLGERPDFVKVVEATEKGFPHIHAIVFLDEDQTLTNGMPWLESKGAISSYWSKYQGSIVDVKPLVWEDDLPDEYDSDEGWVRWDSEGDHGGPLGDSGQEGHQTAGQYLGKYLSAIYGGMRSAAGLEAGGGQLVTDGGRDLADEELNTKYEDKAATWKIAMYWATRRKIRTESRELRQVVEELHEDEEENEDRAAVAAQIRENRYEFVGAYRYGEIPAHIRNGAVPVDSLMQSLEDEGIREVNPHTAGDSPPDRRRVDLLSRTPSSAWGLLPVELEGSGMLFGGAGPDRGDDLGDDRGADVLEDEPDPLAYPEDPMTEEEREEAEELGGFDASGFM